MSAQNAFEIFEPLPPDTKTKLLKFGELLREVNQKVNLLSRKDMDDVEYRHIAFCLSISKFFTPNDGARIVDVGTGGGLPGVVMAIAWPQAHITMLDGVGKKINMINFMLERLGLANAEALHERVEEQKKSFDYAVGRSVCALPQFFGFVKNKLTSGKKGSLENGVIYFKGGDIEPELAAKNILPDASLDLRDFFGDDRFEGKKLVHFKTRDIVRA